MSSLVWLNSAQLRVHNYQTTSHLLPRTPPDYDVSLLTEAWLSDDIPEHVAAIDVYEPFEKTIPYR